jgi:hypothetical protein
MTVAAVLLVVAWATGLAHNGTYLELGTGFCPKC